MDNEPLYEYVRGQGWVVQPPTPLCRSWTIEHTVETMGKYLVTLYQRKPILGERYYSLSTHYNDANGDFNFPRVWNALKIDMEFRPLGMGGHVYAQHLLDMVNQYTNPIVTIHVQPI